MPKKKHKNKSLKEKLLPNLDIETDDHAYNCQSSAPEIDPEPEPEPDINSDCCIICQEDIQPLIKNTYCACNIYWHTTCWDLYLQKTSVPKCLMCRKILDIVVNKDAQKQQSEQTINNTDSTNIFEETSRDMNIDYRELTNNITIQMNNVSSNLESILERLFINNQQPVLHSIIEIPSQQNQHHHQQQSQNQNDEEEQEVIRRRNKKITEIILITSVIIGILIAILLTR